MGARGVTLPPRVKGGGYVMGIVCHCATALVALVELAAVFLMTKGVLLVVRRHILEP